MGSCDGCGCWGGKQSIAATRSGAWCRLLGTGSVELVESREFRVQLPSDVPPTQYAVIVHAVAGVLDAAGLVARSSIFVDDVAHDDDLNEAFDQFSALYPWSDR